MSGIDSFSYYITNFLGDILISVMYCGINLMIVFFWFRTTSPASVSLTAFWECFGIVLAWLGAYATQTYLFTFLFKTTKTAVKFLPLLN